MSHPQTDFSAARTLMVDGQVRPNKVTDARVLAAMGSLPRERFVPADRTALAYSDEDVPLGGGRYLVEPMVIARLVQIAAVRTGERALVVGAGTGYGAALLAACGAKPGDRIELSAEGTTDPDGDALSYEWFYYGEPGTFTVSVARSGQPLEIKNFDQPRASFTVPTSRVLRNGTMHVILAVTDHGTPRLTRYQRVIVNVAP